MYVFVEARGQTWLLLLRVAVYCAFALSIYLGLCVGMCYISAGPLVSRRGCRIPGAGIIDSCEPPAWVLGAGLQPLEEQHTLSTHGHLFSAWILYVSSQDGTWVFMIVCTYFMG